VKKRNPLPGSYVEASYKKIPKASNFPDYKKERSFDLKRLRNPFMA